MIYSSKEVVRATAAATAAARKDKKGKGKGKAGRKINGGYVITPVTEDLDCEF